MLLTIIDLLKGLLLFIMIMSKLILTLSRTVKRTLDLNLTILEWIVTVGKLEIVIKNI